MNYEQMEHHPLSEKIVNVMKDRTQSDSTLFFRLMVANYFAMAAASMRTKILMPEGNTVPVNMYSLNLAPSNFGKTRAAKIITEEVLDQFIPAFTKETFPIQADEKLYKLANSRSIRKASDPDDEKVAVDAEFKRAGELLFCFNSGSAPGAKQLRHKLLMAQAGSLNLVVDEVGQHMGKNQELLETFLELYDGKVGNSLNKNTNDNPRNVELDGVTPSNMILFGTSNKLLDGAAQEKALMEMLESGYARRCFFGFVERNNKKTNYSAQEYLDMAKRASESTVLQEISDQLVGLADMINCNKTLIVPDDTALEMFAYRADCEKRVESYKVNEDIRRTETMSRFFKTIKLAGAYAFIDDSPEITVEHLHAAIKICEESGKAFERLLKRDKPYVKLAKYMAEVGEEVTHPDLMEDLSFYPKSSKDRSEMLEMATAWGYKNNVIIKKTWQNDIQFFRGETLQKTDLSAIPIAWSTDITENYQNEFAPFDQLHKVTQSPNMHWISHHLRGGYREESNIEAGFSVVVLDVDGGVPLVMAQELLKEYKYLMYTTKRHTDQENRFRIILPTNYRLELDAKEYKEFMNNIYDWIPFELDDVTNQRARKWMSFNGQHYYNDGQLLDVLPFIPKTEKNEEHRKQLESQRDMDNLERWVINNSGDGNRNNMLLRYALLLADSHFAYDQIYQRTVDLNSKMSDSIEEAEIATTIMQTVGKRINNVQP